MNTLTLRAALTLTVSAAAIMVPHAASAQEVPSVQPAGQEAQAGLEDIVVTARRSSESLINVPVAVTAVSADKLIQSNVTSLEAAAPLIPFVQIARVGAGSGGLFNIRGIMSTPQDAGVQQSVLTNVDSVLISEGRLSGMAMFDLAQIEVLKGPQPLFFGKNTPAGVISVTSADPTRSFQGYVRASYEFEARQRTLDAAVSGPLTDMLSARLAGHYSKMRGWIYNVAKAQPYPANAAFNPWRNAGATLPGATKRWGPSDEELGARLSLLFEPSSDLTAKFKYSFAQVKTGGEDELYIPWCRPANGKMSSYGTLDPDSDCNFDNRFAASDLPQVLTAGSALLSKKGGKPYSIDKGHIASLSLDYAINDDLALTSITGWWKVTHDGMGIYNQTSFAGVASGRATDNSAISQELRLKSSFAAPVNFEIGAFFDHKKEKNDTDSIVTPLAADPATGRYFTYARYVRRSADSYSMFGRVWWDITDQLELSGGVRYTNYKLHSVDGNSYVHSAVAGTGFRAAGDYFDRKYKDDNYSPEVVLTWHPAARQTAYISYKEGYKSGGFSYPATLRTSYTLNTTKFAPESARSWELGYKAELMDRRLRVEAVAYRTVFDGLQLSSFDPTQFSFFVSNAGSAKLQGFELQTTFLATTGLTLDGSIGYNDAKYTSYVAAPCQVATPRTIPCVGGVANLSGYRLPRAPQWQGNIGFNYETPITSSLKAGLNGRASFTDSYLTLDTLDLASVQKSFWKLDAGISIADIDDRWKLALIGRNLTNEFVNIFTFDGARGFPGEYIGIPQRDRQISLQASLNF